LAAAPYGRLFPHVLNGGRHVWMALHGTASVLPKVVLRWIESRARIVGALHWVRRAAGHKVVPYQLVCRLLDDVGLHHSLSQVGFGRMACLSLVGSLQEDAGTQCVDHVELQCDQDDMCKLLKPCSSCFSFISCECYYVSHEYILIGIFLMFIKREARFLSQ